MRVNDVKHSQILKWIDDFYNNFSKNPDDKEKLRKQFMNGYC